MIGAIIGDIVGSRFEWDNYLAKDFELFTEECFPTDDSIMTIAIAEAVMDADSARVVECACGVGETIASCARFVAGWGQHELKLLAFYAVTYMQNIGQNYPDCGYGGRFINWLFSLDPEPYNSFGNGAAMRVSPAAFAAASLEDAKALAKAVTAVTHNHPEGLKGAEATAVAIYMARTGSSKQEIEDYINENYYDIDFTLDDIRGSYGFDVTCQGTVPQAIEAFLEADSFEDAIRNAISIGGDSDTIAAITGSIAEAYFGVPEEIAKEAMGFLDPQLAEVVEKWYEIYGQEA